MIELTQQHLDEIGQHGERSYPHECCGLLIGEFEADGRKAVREILPVENAREDGARHNRSLITAPELMRGERYAREKKLEVIGNYHSHPDHPARPSAFDLEHALPVWAYLIVAVAEGQAQELRAWEMRADRTQFDELEIRHEVSDKLAAFTEN